MEHVDTKYTRTIHTHTYYTLTDTRESEKGIEVRKVQELLGAGGRAKGFLIVLPPERDTADTIDRR